MNNIDNINPSDKWVFDENVADCFDNMLERSIPQYEVMRKSCANLTYEIISSSKKQSFTVLDVGCSNGIMLNWVIDRFKSEHNDNGKFVGVDVSDSMLQKAKFRFLDDIINNKVSIYNCDLRTDFPDGVYDVVLSVLSIQFTPIEYRQHIIQNIYNSLSKSSGCFIMVEKVLGNTDRLNNMFVDEYYNMKRANGYSQEQIDRKRLSLEGVLVPVTSDWNIQLLKQAGFREIDVFWRWMNFVGYIAIK